MKIFKPLNESGVVFLFGMLIGQTDWKVQQIQIAFPDAILERGGEIWRTEFEYKSYNFRKHRHHFDKCDLIICWEHNYNNCPLPVIELSNSNWMNIEIHRSTSRGMKMFMHRKGLQYETDIGRKSD